MVAAMKGCGKVAPEPVIEAGPGVGMGVGLGVGVGAIVAVGDDCW